MKNSTMDSIVTYTLQVKVTPKKIKITGAPPLWPVTAIVAVILGDRRRRGEQPWLGTERMWTRCYLGAKGLQRSFNTSSSLQVWTYTIDLLLTPAFHSLLPYNKTQKICNNGIKFLSSTVSSTVQSYEEKYAPKLFPKGYASSDPAVIKYYATGRRKTSVARVW